MGGWHSYPLCRTVLGCFIVPIGATMTERQIEYFQHLGSTVLISTPSYALYLAERMKQKGISAEQIRLRCGCFGGEAGTEVPTTRKKIEKGLRIDAFDYYGLAELGPTCASECRQKAGIHFVEDHILVEAVNLLTGKSRGSGQKLLPIGVLCQIKSNGHNVYARFNPGVLPAYFLPPRYIC